MKCLVLYHPEDVHALRLAQERSVAEVYRACCQSGHELLLELILPPDMSHSDDLYLRAVSRFYNLGFTPTAGSCRRSPLRDGRRWKRSSNGAIRTAAACLFSALMPRRKSCVPGLTPRPTTRG